MSKYIKKIVTALWTIVLVAMFLVLIAFGVLLVPAVGRFAAQKASAALSEAAGVPVSIGSLRYVPFSTFEVNDVLVQEADSSPMIRVSRAKAEVSLYSLLRGRPRLSLFETENVDVFVRRRSDGGLNVATLVPDAGSPSHGGGAFFSVGLIKARQCNVRYEPRGGDVFEVRDLEVDASGLRKTPGGLGLSVSDFSFFAPDYGARFAFGGRVSLSGDTVSVGGAYLSLGGFAAKVDTAAAVVDSAGLRMAKVEIPNARAAGGIASRLLGRNVPQCSFSVSAQFFGSDLSVNYLRLSLGEATNVSAKGGARLSRQGGRMLLDHCNLTLSGWVKPSDIQNLLSGGASSSPIPSLPFEGSVTSTGTNASLGLNVNSEYGRMSLYANAGSADGWASVDANVQLSGDLTPSKLTNGAVDRLVAHFSSSGRVALGGGSRVGLRYATMRGGVDRADFLGHSFGGVSFDGVADGQGVNFRLGVDDPLAHVTLFTEALWDGVSPYVAVTAEADSVSVGALAPSVFPARSVLGFKMRVETMGLDLRSSQTDLLVSALTLRSDTSEAQVDYLSASLGSEPGGDRVLRVRSDVAEAVAKGNFDIAGLAAEMRSQAHSALPALVSRPRLHSVMGWRPRAQKAGINAKVFGVDNLCAMLCPQFHLHDTLTFNGQVDSEGSTSWAEVKTGSLAFADFRLDSVGVSVVSNAGKADVAVQVSRLGAPLVGSLSDVRLDVAAESDYLTADLSWGGASPSGGGLLNLDAAVETARKGGLVWNVGVDKSVFPAGDAVWRVDSCRIAIADDYVDVRNLNAYSGIHSVWASGRASASVDDTLRLRLDNVVLEDVLKTDANSKYSFEGDLSLSAEACGMLGEPSFDVRADVSRLKVNGDNLERLDVRASRAAGSDSLRLGLAIVTSGAPRAVADGAYCFSTDRLDLPFKIDSLSTGFLNFYLDNCIDQWKGSTSGSLSLHGPLADIALDANLKMNDDNFFRVKQTDVTYHIDNNDSLTLSPSSMDFHDIRFTDRNGHHGIFSGFIKHRMFSHLDLGLDFLVDDMVLLQTDSEESPTYYGDIYGSGRMSITGPTSNVDILINAKTGKNSTFTVAPNAKSDLSNADFIVFDSDEAKASKLADILGTGTSATLKLHVTPDAKLSVVIDPKTGNQLTGTGAGDLTVEVGRTGALDMHGNYVIDAGTYNFSFSVFDKQFTIDNGSSIYWDGGPYDATVNIAATYLVKASIYSLVSGTSYDNNADLKRRVPVKCKIFLTGRLTQPDIRFGIEIPSSQNFNQYAFDQYVNTQEEVSRQVFALLTSGQFYALQDANQQSGQSQSYLGMTASELLSNKLSSIFSKNDRNIGIGVNYRPGDEVANEEYEVAISTQAFDNKVLLSGNIGYGRDATGASSDDGTLIGDFDVEVKLNQRGNIRAKAYTHSNNDVIYETSPTTQGVGISFQEEFDSFRELFRAYWRRIFHRSERRHAEDAAAPATDESAEKTDSIRFAPTRKE